MNKIFGSISAIAAAALVAGAITILPGSDQVAASTQGAAPVKCSEQAWPYIEARCLRGAEGQAKPARIVTTDRVQGGR